MQISRSKVNLKAKSNVSKRIFCEYFRHLQGFLFESKRGIQSILFLRGNLRKHPLFIAVRPLN